MIGVDVVDLERLRPRLRQSRWRRLAFTATETAAAEGLSPDTAERRLAMTWAAKEAVVKALRTGFGPSRPPVALSILFELKGPRVATVFAGACSHLHAYHLSCSSTAGVAVAVCQIDQHDCKVGA